MSWILHWIPLDNLRLRSAIQVKGLGTCSVVAMVTSSLGSAYFQTLRYFSPVLLITST